MTRRAQSTRPQAPPVSMATMVDFPAPLGPSSPVTWPSYSARFKGRTAWTGGLPPDSQAGGSLRTVPMSISTKCSEMETPPRH
jgi:hypothetical protein